MASPCLSQWQPAAGFSSMTFNTYFYRMIILTQLFPNENGSQVRAVVFLLYSKIDVFSPLVYNSMN